MDKSILDYLKTTTPEEQAILDGSATIDRNLYMQGTDNTIIASKLLAAGKLISLRPHTRFIHFPVHTHDYVEVVYMCTGRTTHVVNGIPVELNQGELLFICQNVSHEILPATEEDLAVNLIILPDYFTSVLENIGEEKTPLRTFLADCLCGRISGTGFLHFKVAENIPVQNLIENLIFSLLQKMAYTQKTNQMTLTLLILHLINCVNFLETPVQEQTDVFKILSYIEVHYATGSLTQLAQDLHYDVHSLSRKIKNELGKSYTQLIQEKRLSQAAFLLKNTNRNVDHIANAVGYENLGYFHRIFKEHFGRSPRSYRLQMR